MGTWLSSFIYAPYNRQRILRGSRIPMAKRPKDYGSLLPYSYTVANGQTAKGLWYSTTLLVHGRPRVSHFGTTTHDFHHLAPTHPP